MVGSIDPKVRENPWDPLACKGRCGVRNSQRGKPSHLGQRFTNRIYRPYIWMSDPIRPSKNSCGTGAVHIWVPACVFAWLGRRRVYRIYMPSPNDLPRHRPHPLPRGLSRSARRKPGGPGAPRRHLVARGAGYPRLGDRPPPSRRRLAGGRRTGHGAPRRRARRGDRRGLAARRPPAPADEPAGPSAHPGAGPRPCRQDRACSSSAAASRGWTSG